MVWVSVILISDLGSDEVQVLATEKLGRRVPRMSAAPVCALADVDETTLHASVFVIFPRRDQVLPHEFGRAELLATAPIPGLVALIARTLARGTAWLLVGTEGWDGTPLPDGMPPGAGAWHAALADAVARRRFRLADADTVSAHNAAHLRRLLCATTRDMWELYTHEAFVTFVADAQIALGDRARPLQLLEE